MQRGLSSFVRPRLGGEQERDGGGMVHGVGIVVEHGGKDGDIIGKGHVASHPGLSLGLGLPPH